MESYELNCNLTVLPNTEAQVKNYHENLLMSFYQLRNDDITNIIVQHICILRILSQLNQLLKRSYFHSIGETLESQY